MFCQSYKISRQNKRHNIKIKVYIQLKNTAIQKQQIDQSVDALQWNCNISDIARYYPFQADLSSRIIYLNVR